MTGPDNDSDYDRLRRRVLWSFPSGLYVVGSRSGERRNAMTLNWAMQVSMEPKHLAISVVKSAFTHELIIEGGHFSVCSIAREDRALVRKFVKPVSVEEEGRLLNGVPFTEGVTGAPVLAAAVATVECRLVQTVDVGDHSLFVGEIVAARFLRDEATPVLRMEDTRMNYGG